MISVFCSALASRAFSTLRILPRIGQHRLGVRVATLFGRPGGRLSLDDEELGLVGVAR